MYKAILDILIAYVIITFATKKYARVAELADAHV